MLKRSIELDCEFAEPHSFLASLYEDKGYYKDANELHLRALQIQPMNADLRNNYGAFLHKIGKLTVTFRLKQTYSLVEQVRFTNLCFVYTTLKIRLAK